MAGQAINNIATRVEVSKKVISKMTQAEQVALLNKRIQSCAVELTEINDKIRRVSSSIRTMDARAKALRKQGVSAKHIGLKSTKDGLKLLRGDVKGFRSRRDMVLERQRVAIKEKELLTGEKYRELDKSFAQYIETGDME